MVLACYIHSSKEGHFGFYRTLANGFSLMHPQWQNRVSWDFTGLYQMVFIHSGKIGSFWSLQDSAKWF